MRSDVSAHEAVTQSFSLASATLAIARDGAETVVALLDRVKAKVVAAQEDNVDRSKIRTDLDILRKQIGAVVDGAQFNGANLLKSDGPVSFLGMVSRLSDGGVNAHFIDLAGLDLGMTTGSDPVEPTPAAPRFETTGDLTVSTAPAGPEPAMTLSGVATGGNLQFDYAGEPVDLYIAAGMSPTGGTSVDFDLGMATMILGINSMLSSGGVDAIHAWIDGAPTFAGWTQVDVQYATDPTDPQQKASILVTADGPYTLSVSTTAVTAPDPAPASDPTASAGGLAALAGFDMNDTASRTAALTAIETLIATSTSAAARLGAEEARVAIQSDVVSKFSAALVSGVGALVDADIEEASARQQALDVKRQLSLDALSIANRAPRALLAPFAR